MWRTLAKKSPIFYWSSEKESHTDDMDVRGIIPTVKSGQSLINDPLHVIL